MQTVHKIVISVLLSLIIGVTLIGCDSVSESRGDFLDAPKFELDLFEHNNDLDSSTLRFPNDLTGQPVIINFWYPSCPPCREEIDILESTYKEYKENGLVIVGIQSLVLDSVEDGKQFVHEYGITYPVGADIGSNIQISYKVIGFPTTYFLNRDHEIIRKWSGLLDNEQLQEFVTEILK